MTTVGNHFVGDHRGSTPGNHLVESRVESEGLVDPTLGNGDGTYNVTIGASRVVTDPTDGVAVKWDGTHRARVDSVSGNTVTVIFEEPDGSSGWTTVSDGSITGTLKVIVIQ